MASGAVLGDAVLILKRAQARRTGCDLGLLQAARGGAGAAAADAARRRPSEPGVTACAPSPTSSSSTRSSRSVVNLAIVLVGWRALSALPVQQYPKIESSSVVDHHGLLRRRAPRPCAASSPRPIERAVSAISGVDYVESTSRAGVSTITVHLKLNHNSTAALAEVTARLQQVRSELPAEAEPPVVEVQRADRPYASFYLSFTSTQRDVPAITDWLAAHAAAAALDPAGRAAGDHRGRPAARDAGLDRSRRGWRRSTSRPATCTRRSGATTTSPRSGQTKGNLVQVNLLANTDLRSVDEFKDLIVADRNGAIVRLSDVAKVELGAEEADLSPSTATRRRSTSASGRWSGSTRSRCRTGCGPRWSGSARRCRKDIDMQLAYDAHGVHGGRARRRSPRRWARRS